MLGRLGEGIDSAVGHTAEVANPSSSPPYWGLRKAVET
jgi:hypothetical protein